ncbi:hypothetical protein LZ30DRAFT_569187, partial [Colletotrichum cereale]
IKTTAAEPQMTDATARSGQASRLSDCVPKQADLSIVETHGDSGNPRYNATHAGHHSGLHSAAYIMEQQTPAEDMGDSDQLLPHRSSADPVQNKIDKMYHHAKDLKRARHIMEHLAAGFSPTKGATQAPQEGVLEATRLSTPCIENLLSQAGSAGLNREKPVSLEMAMAEDRNHIMA